VFRFASSRRRRADLVAAGAGVPVHAQTAWTNYIDASMINEIVYRDGVLYMATFGGLLLYDVADNRFEQFDNVDGLPSNSLRCLVFEDDDDLYIGFADLGVAKVRFSGGVPVLARSLNEQIDGLSSNAINPLTWGADILYGDPAPASFATTSPPRYSNATGSRRRRQDVLPTAITWIATNAGVATSIARVSFAARRAPTIANVPAPTARTWSAPTTAWRRSGFVGTDVDPTRASCTVALGRNDDAGRSTRTFRYTGTGQSGISSHGRIVNYNFTVVAVNQIRSCRRETATLLAASNRTTCAAPI
jgi:hypothetical protein